MMVMLRRMMRRMLMMMLRMMLREMVKRMMKIVVATVIEISWMKMLKVLTKFATLEACGCVSF